MVAGVVVETLGRDGPGTGLGGTVVDGRLCGGGTALVLEVDPARASAIRCTVELVEVETLGLGSIGLEGGCAGGC